MPGLRIALDIDSVLAHTHKVMDLVVKDMFGVPFHSDAVYQWDSEKCLLHMYGIKLTGQEYLALFDKVWSRWQEIPPTEPYARQVYWDLVNEGHEVDIVTYAKTDGQFDNKRKWLSFIMGIGLGSKRVINSRHSAGWKYEMDYDVFIEDCPHIAVGAWLRGKVSYLYDQPWNRGVSDNYITERIYTLERLKTLLRYPKLESFP